MINKRSIILILIICVIAIVTSRCIYINLNNKYNSINNSSDIAIIIDNQKSKTIPERGLYKVNVECNTGSGEWDYNSWSVNLSNVQKDSKCTIEFTSDMTESEYSKLIDEGIGLRRNTYRGKDITDYHEDGSLYTMIENGTFDDIYVGDYIIANNIKWLVADIDNYLNSTNALTKHHLTIIPATILGKSAINNSETSVGGYYGSNMVQTILPNILETYIKPAFGDHVLTYRNLLSNSINESLKSSGYGAWLGTVNGWVWCDRQLDLMSEVNVYGKKIFSSSGYDIGIDSSQYAIFKLKPQLMYSNGTEKFHYWLKNVSGNGHFVYMDASGTSNIGVVTFEEFGIRPRFLIG